MTQKQRQDELNEAWCKYTNKCSTEIMQALAFALRWCDEYPRWISVEEELPQGWALVCEEKTHCVSIARLMYNEETKRNYWEELDGYPLPDNVTHWMPLPQPPEHIADASKMIEKGGEE